MSPLPERPPIMRSGEKDALSKDTRSRSRGGAEMAADVKEFKQGQQQAAVANDDDDGPKSKAAKKAEKAARRAQKSGGDADVAAAKKAAAIAAREAAASAAKEPSSTPSAQSSATSSAVSTTKFSSHGGEQIAVVDRLQENKQVSLFSHLEQTRRLSTAGVAKDVHPAVLALGLHMAEYSICGSNARCLATLTAFTKVIQDYQTPSGTTLPRHLTTHLNAQIAYLISSRPLSVSMGNAIRHIKLLISAVSIDTPEDEAKAALIEEIETFVREKIIVADRVIVESGCTKIRDGDVVLVYAKSSVVEQLLLEAWRLGRQFRVIVIDSRPLFEGRHMLRTLAQAGIPVQYGFLSSIAYLIKSVTKVFLGAHAMLFNGSMYARVGTALVAMTARDSDIPVIVCCESYKFTERVQLDSFVFNELASPDDLVTTSIGEGEEKKEGPLKGWREMGGLRLLNLMYDVTPVKDITMVVSEVGMLPATTIAVVVHETKLQG